MELPKTASLLKERDMPLQIGDNAPDFTLLSDDNLQITLSKLRGKKVILYFYPKDDTPGCTQQACDFRDKLPDFHKTSAVVLGVSKDDAISHSKFKKKFSLNFALLADTEGKVCDAYGVMAEKSMYGKTYWGIERTTFLINEKGKISNIWHKVKVPGHIQEVLQLTKI